ncbi:hypothetical protein MLD52_15100 [Puniceicoccaceae bacterium K14]|nr:hypothetical protein [Puniceicoccaceae bacterium K14]
MASRITFLKFQDLSDLVLSAAAKLPNDIDLVVGIPRSGLLAANMLSTFLNKPLSDLAGFNANVKVWKSQRMSLGGGVEYPNEARKVLLVDDSIHSGISLEMAKESLKLEDRDVEILTFVPIATESVLDRVDYYGKVINVPRLFEWNIMNHPIMEWSCVDIDGVLCDDPSPEDNDDGEKYMNFILNAPPKFIPKFEIGCLVTSRLEKYRDATVEWMNKHGIKFRDLRMIDVDTAEERRRLKLHIPHKAKMYDELSDFRLFYESESWQASEIHRLTKRPVFCVDSWTLHQKNDIVVGGAKRLVKRVLPKKIVNILRGR